MEIILGTQLSNVAAQTTLDLQGLVTSMKASGMSNTAIKASLMSDLTGGGRLFGNYRNQVKNTVKSGIGMAGNNASQGVFKNKGVKEFRWITVSGKPCPDCEERHNETGTMEYFETIGLPKSGFSVCQQHCQCQLLPVDYKGENLDKPLVREKMPIDVPKMAGKHKTVADAQKWAEKNISHEIDLRGVDNLDAINTVNKTMSRLNKKYGISKLNKITYSTGANFNAGGMANYQVLQLHRQIFDDYMYMHGKKYDKIFHSRFGVSDGYKGIKRLEALLTHEHGHVVADQLFGQINGKDLLKKYSFGMSEKKAISQILNNPKVLDKIIKSPLEKRTVLSYAQKTKMREKWHEIWVKAQKDLNYHKQSSEYGFVMEEELFAEAYCMREMGEKLPDYIEDFFRELIK